MDTMQANHDKPSIRIELDGDFWGLSALSLAERLPLAELLDAKRVVLSLERVRHIDQAGLAMLVRMYSQLRVRGVQLQLVDAPDGVRAVLDRVGLADLVSRSNGQSRATEQRTVVLGAQAET
ncbi:MAG: STAS domain-containing protein [Polyangiales bacterium]